ncbi:MAG: LysM domain-containing protein [Candidatus Limnocylindrales bacterium]|nr:LysM domain-containing protein [Candidatus Limnocylindrales bacterium]
MAVSPPVPLAPEKQRRLCLVGDHIRCATYGAALATHSGPAQHLTGHSRPIARMTPVILDQGRFDLRMPALRADRASGQALLVGLLGLAFGAILLARPAGDAGAGPLGAEASASPRASVRAATDAAAAPPTAAPAETTEPPAETDDPSGTAGPSIASNAPASSAAPSPGASAEPATSGATYKVKSGDTLSAIAARFGTTTRVLIRLNGIADPSKLKIGQILRLP